MPLMRVTENADFSSAVSRIRIECHSAQSLYRWKVMSKELKEEIKAYTYRLFRAESSAAGFSWGIYPGLHLVHPYPNVFLGLNHFNNSTVTQYNTMGCAGGAARKEYRAGPSSNVDL
jgi:hypothetical protein